MVLRSVVIGLAALMVVPALFAEDINGTIVVTKRLTKRRVTASLPSYQHGTAVALATDTPESPLAFERSRVAVYVEGPGPVETEVAIIGQENRRFGQETVVIPVGSRVSFPNLDPVFHNVFSLSGAKTFDLGNYPRGQTRVVKFDRPGIVFVNCHLHPNMSAAIVVTPNRWKAQVDQFGHFSIHGIPPGNYTIVAWHKAAGIFRRKIEVTAGNVTDVEIMVPVREGGMISARDARDSRMQVGQ